MKKKRFFTKKFYTVAELANLLIHSRESINIMFEAYKKYPKDELVLYNLQHAYDMAYELNYLLEQNDAVDIVVDYVEGIDRTTGNNKIYVK